MRFLILIICAFVVITTKAQTSLPGTDSLFASVDSFYQQILAAELKAFEANPKDYWMNFVPSVGVGYAIAPDKNGNLKSKIRPSISFSLNSILAFRKEKQQIKAIKESLILKNQIERQRTKASISKIYQQIKILQEDLKFSLTVFEIEKQLFEFHEKQHQNNDIKPSEFLLKKIAHLKKEEIIRTQQREIEILILELFETSNYKF